MPVCNRHKYSTKRHVEGGIHTLLPKPHAHCGITGTHVGISNTASGTYFTCLCVRGNCSRDTLMVGKIHVTLSQNIQAGEEHASGFLHPLSDRLTVSITQPIRTLTPLSPSLPPHLWPSSDGIISVSGVLHLTSRSAPTISCLHTSAHHCPTPSPLNPSVPNLPTT